MIFSSYEFIFLLLPISVICYFLLIKVKKYNLSKYWLLLSSLFFYSWWNIFYLPLMLISIVVNFKISQYLIMNKLKNKKIIFIFGLIFNIFLLFYFKYIDFFIWNVNYIFNENFDLLQLALPLAISFFTLQQITYLVDSYQGMVKEKNFLDYSIFVTFFPQLIAGPIVHHKEMMPQFESLKNKAINYENISKGLFIFSIGLFKKVIIADSFAKWANNGFNNADNLNLFEAWITSYSYTFQLYFDFSGYADMAIGAALLFNIKLPINFNSPLKSLSIIEFWQKWHITLSNFITSYLFFPLSKSFKKLTFEKTMLAIFIATLISGLWHGAAWTFVFYGAFHGIGLIVNHYWKRKVKIKINRIIAWFITFNFVNISFVFFRADSFEQAVSVIKAMFGFSYLVLPGIIYSKLSFLSDYGFTFGNMVANIKGDILVTSLAFVVAFILIFQKNSNEITSKMKPSFKYSVFTAMLFSISVLNLNKVQEFIYFNF